MHPGHTVRICTVQRARMHRYTLRIHELGKYDAHVSVCMYVQYVPMHLRACQRVRACACAARPSVRLRIEAAAHLGGRARVPARRCRLQDHYDFVHVGHWPRRGVCQGIGPTAAAPGAAERVYADYPSLTRQRASPSRPLLQRPRRRHRTRGAGRQNHKGVVAKMTALHSDISPVLHN